MKQKVHPLTYLGAFFPESPAKRFASLSESGLEELVSERHSKTRKKTQTGLDVSTFTGKQKVIKA